MLRRKKFEDEEDAHDRWLISYADFITLLFAFFVVMYATSNINLNKYKALSSAVVSAFQGSNTGSGVGQGAAKMPVSVLKPLPLSHIYHEKRQRDAEKLHAIGVSLANTYAEWIDSSELHIYQHPRGLRIDIQDQLLFKPGSTEQTIHANRLLYALNKVLENEYRFVQIEGHGEQKALAGSQAESAWEVSAFKAARIAQMLVSHGFISKRLSATGFADTHPVSSGETVLAKANNQRISIWILSVDNDVQAAQDESVNDEILPAPALPASDTPAVTPATAGNTSATAVPAP